MYNMSVLVDLFNVCMSKLKGHQSLISVVTACGDLGSRFLPTSASQSGPWGGSDMSSRGLYYLVLTGM